MIPWENWDWQICQKNFNQETEKQKTELQTVFTRNTYL